MTPLRPYLHLGGLCLLMAMLLLVQPARADGWTLKRGRAYYKIGLYTFRATRYYDPGGALIQIPTLSDYTFSFYGEYGFTDRITVVAYVPFFERITLNKQVGSTSGFVFSDGDAVTSIADPIIGVRFGLIQGGPTVLSARFNVGLPLGNDDQPSGLYTGDGELNQMIGLEAGHSFYPIPAYAIATIGFNQRSKGFSDEVVYSVEAGYTVANAFTFIARMRGVEPMRNGDPDIGGGRGLYGNNQRFLSFGAELAYTRNDAYGLSIGVEGVTRAQNVLSAPALSIGFFVKT